MAIPNINALLLPFLRLLQDGKEHSVSETGLRLAEHFELRAGEWETSSSGEPRGGFYYRFGWARTYLKQAGLITSRNRGSFRITDQGAQLLLGEPQYIERQILEIISEVSGTRRDRWDAYRMSKTGRADDVQKAPTSAAPKNFQKKVPIGSDAAMYRRAGKPPVKPKSQARRKVASGAASASRPNIKPETDDLSYHAVEVFFGTDRATIASATPGERFTNARGELQLGVCTVSIPRDHEIGVIESPKWYRLEFTENPAKHVVLLKAELMNQELFSNRLRVACQNPTQSAFVFVHGFNVSFENAAQRTAQIAFDLGLKIVPAFFSWPSQGNLTKYDVDAGNIEWTEPNLEKFLTVFAEKTQVQEIFIIAHSMGTRAVTRVLAKLLNAKTGLRQQYRELILAAPDIDADVFKNVLLPGISANQQNVTMYSSSNDRALNLSKKFTAHPRAGDSNPQPVIGPGLETIDASEIETDFLGHSYFAQERPLLTDIALLLNNKLRAADRPTLQVKTYGTEAYWAFKG